MALSALAQYRFDPQLLPTDSVILLTADSLINNLNILSAHRTLSNAIAHDQVTFFTTPPAVRAQNWIGHVRVLGWRAHQSVAPGSGVINVAPSERSSSTSSKLYHETLNGTISRRTSGCYIIMLRVDLLSSNDPQ
jgi:hypothetical protein